MSDERTPQKWNDHYANAAWGVPARVLLENGHLLPAGGDALEIACGMGASALFMAERGLRVRAWDSAVVAIERLQQQATERQLPVTAEVRDSVQAPPAALSCDVIVVSHFLDRTLFPPLLAALRPGGLLFYQTFIKARIDDTGPRNEAYRLGDNELLTLCQPLRILVYREEGVAGDTTQGWRNLAMVVGQRR